MFSYMPFGVESICSSGVMLSFACFFLTIVYFCVSCFCVATLIMCLCMMALYGNHSYLTTTSGNNKYDDTVLDFKKFGSPRLDNFRVFSAS